MNKSHGRIEKKTRKKFLMRLELVFFKSEVYCPCNLRLQLANKINLLLMILIKPEQLVHSTLQHTHRERQSGMKMLSH